MFSIFMAVGSQPGNASQEFLSPSGMKRISSISSLTGQVRAEYKTIWKAIHMLSNDPHPEVAKMAESIIDDIRQRLHINNNNGDNGGTSHSGSPLNGSSSKMSQDVPDSVMPPTRHLSHIHSASAFQTPHRHHTVSEGPITSNSSCASVTRRKTNSNNNVNISNQISNTTDNGDTDSTSSSTRGQSIVSTHFISWCVKQFINQSCRLEAWDPESIDHQKKEQAFGHQILVSELARDELSRVDPTRIEEQVLLLKHNNKPRFMSIHPFEPHLFIAERDSFTVLMWEGLKPQDKPSSSTQSFPAATVIASSKNRVTIPSTSSSATASCMNTSSHSSFPSITSTITSMELLNVNNMSPLLALGSDDGSVRIWSLDNRLSASESNRVKPKMISAFYVFRDSVNSQDKSMINAFASSRDTSVSVTPFKTVFSWEQESCCFIAGSNTSRSVKVWDANQEKVVRVIRTDSDAGVNTISSDGHNIICAGFMDGTVRTIDRREGPLAEKTRVFREHESPVVSAHLFSQDVAHLSVLTGSASGEVKFWDKRLSASIKTITLGQDLATMTVHPETDVFAW